MISPKSKPCSKSLKVNCQNQKSKVWTNTKLTVHKTSPKFNPKSQSGPGPIPGPFPGPIQGPIQGPIPGPRSGPGQVQVRSRSSPGQVPVRSCPGRSFLTAIGKREDHLHAELEQALHASLFQRFLCLKKNKSFHYRVKLQRTK